MYKSDLLYYFNLTKQQAYPSTVKLIKLSTYPIYLLREIFGQVPLTILLVIATANFHTYLQEKEKQTLNIELELNKAKTVYSLTVIL